MSEIVYEVAPLFALKRTQADLVPECARYGFFNGASGFLPLNIEKEKENCILINVNVFLAVAICLSIYYTLFFYI